MTDANNVTYSVYLAGPWFSPRQSLVLAEARNALQDAGLVYYDPELMCQCPPEASDDFAKYVLGENCLRIQQARLVYASIFGRDLGTSWEIGYALGLDKQVMIHSPSVATYDQYQRDAIDLLVTDYERLLGNSLGCYYVCDTTDKDPVRVAAAGYAKAKGLPVVYYAPGLPEGALFNLMLAKSGAAVCTDQKDLQYCLSNLDEDSSWYRAYTGLIE